MIRYIKGQVMKAESGRLVVLAGGIGYELLMPEIVWQEYHLQQAEAAPSLELHISYQQTAQQPKPVLIGFLNEVELEFFEMLIRVKDIGPVTAARALTLPVPVIARAIEERDHGTVMKMKGIGKRKADMIISELNGKVGKYALMIEPEKAPLPQSGDVCKQVVDVLVKQLGHNRSEASRLVADALKRSPDAETPEALFEEVYRGTKVER